MAAEIELDTLPGFYFAQEAAGKPLSVEVSGNRSADMPITKLLTKDQCADLAAVMIILGVSGDVGRVNESVDRIIGEMKRAAKKGV